MLQGQSVNDVKARVLWPMRQSHTRAAAPWISEARSVSAILPVVPSTVFVLIGNDRDLLASENRQANGPGPSTHVRACRSRPHPWPRGTPHVYAAQVIEPSAYGDSAGMRSRTRWSAAAPMPSIKLCQERSCPRGLGNLLRPRQAFRPPGWVDPKNLVRVVVVFRIFVVTTTAATGTSLVRRARRITPLYRRGAPSGESGNSR